MVSDGTSQRDRQTPTLHPGFVNVAELSFEDLLATAAKYSHILKFHDLENEVAGDWEPFFTSDEAVILAHILTTKALFFLHSSNIVFPFYFQEGTNVSLP